MASLSVKMNNKKQFLKKEKRAEFFFSGSGCSDEFKRLKNLPVNGSVEAVRTLHILYTDLRTVVS